MNKFLIILSLCLLSCGSFAEQKKNDKLVRRIKIRSADPALIAALLSGHKNFYLPSEISKSGMKSDSTSGKGE